MATLTVWKFDTPNGAEQAYRVLGSLQSQQLLKLHDAAWVEWESAEADVWDSATADGLAATT